MSKVVFPNLARRRDDHADPAVLSEVDSATLRELTAAGITVECHEFLRRSNGEVPTANIGSLCRWGFHRYWYYWVATGPGVPPDVAEEFHKLWGRDVRVDGHCGCPSPLEWFKGFAVGHYHIDTQDGLNAFADLLRSVYREKSDG